MSNFFVHIIESPSDQDFLNGRTEGRLLTEGLSIANIPFSYSIAVNKNALAEALTIRLSNATKMHRLYPILHLSTHGNKDGLALTNGDFCQWSELDRNLSAINTAMGGNLAVSVSACSGFAGCKMAMKSAGPNPFYWIVGPTKEISLPDIAVAFLTLYHLLSKGIHLTDAVTAMKTASGNQNFETNSAQNIKLQWEAFWKNIDARTLAAIVKATGIFK